MRRAALASLCVLLAATLVQPQATAQLALPQVIVVPVAIFDTPVAMAVRAGDPDLYVAEKTGRVRVIRGGLQDFTAVLDLSGEVSGGQEQGLLGLAFSPGGDFLYVNMTDTAGDTRILEFAFVDGRALPETRRQVLFVDQPQANHNGGTLEFGPDGYLYIGLGDGGGAGDPQGNAQNLGTLLGKMLRIDPTPSGDDAYSVPDDNPFVDVEGARPEIWAYGLRNPWKFSFDVDTGDLWIADVGQNAWEEVNLQRADAGGGQNYGWNHMEGTHPYQGGTPPVDHVPPIYEYANATPACSVTGGYLYRGSRIPSLHGAYIFSDWCDGLLRFIREQDGEVVEAGNLSMLVPSTTAFGQDHDGELYGLSFAGPVFRIDPLLPSLDVPLKRPRLLG